MSDTKTLLGPRRSSVRIVHVSSAAGFVFQLVMMTKPSDVVSAVLLNQRGIFYISFILVGAVALRDWLRRGAAQSPSVGTGLQGKCWSFLGCSWMLAQAPAFGADAAIERAPFFVALWMFPALLAWAIVDWWLRRRRGPMSV